MAETLGSHGRPTPAEAAMSGNEGRARIARAFPIGGRLNVNANPKPALPERSGAN